MASHPSGAVAPRTFLGITVLVIFVLSMAGSLARASGPSTGSADLFRLDARARAAAALAAAGNTGDATVQLDRARSEPLTALAGSSDSQALGRLLANLQAAVSSGDRAAATAAVHRIDALAQASVPADAASADLRTLLATLVRDAGREGQEGAAGGGTEPAAYAAALVEITLETGRRVGLSTTAIGALQTLSASLRGEPSSDLVASATDTALAALGARPDTTDTARAFAAIAADLDLAQKRQASGDGAAAGEALIDAYLEHFEGLEPALERLDPALKDRLEHALRDELRGMVRQGVTADAFAKALDAVRADLAQAKAVLP